MKQTLVIALSILMASLALKDLASYAHFYLNRSYIADNLCVNRFEPQVMCSGKCYLEQSIENNRQQQERLPHHFSEKKTNTVYIPTPIPSFITDNTTPLKRLSINIVESTYSFTFLHDVFHPPQVS